jgi:hypothetical protein
VVQAISKVLENYPDQKVATAVKTLVKLYKLSMVGTENGLVNVKHFRRVVSTGLGSLVSPLKGDDSGLIASLLDLLCADDIDSALQILSGLTTAVILHDTILEKGCDFRIRSLTNFLLNSVEIKEDSVVLYVNDDIVGVISEDKREVFVDETLYVMPSPLESIPVEEVVVENVHTRASEVFSVSDDIVAGVKLVKLIDREIPKIRQDFPDFMYNPNDPSAIMDRDQHNQNYMFSSMFEIFNQMVMRGFDTVQFSNLTDHFVHHLKQYLVFRDRFGLEIALNFCDLEGIYYPVVTEHDKFFLFDVWYHISGYAGAMEGLKSVDLPVIQSSFDRFLDDYSRPNMPTIKFYSSYPFNFVISKVGKKRDKTGVHAIRGELFQFGFHPGAKIPITVVFPIPHRTSCFVIYGVHLDTIRESIHLDRDVVTNYVAVASKLLQHGMISLKRTKFLYATNSLFFAVTNWFHTSLIRIKKYKGYDPSNAVSLFLGRKCIFMDAKMKKHSDYNPGFDRRLLAIRATAHAIKKQNWSVDDLLVAGFSRQEINHMQSTRMVTPIYSGGRLCYRFIQQARIDGGTFDGGGVSEQDVNDTNDGNEVFSRNSSIGIAYTDGVFFSDLYAPVSKFSRSNISLVELLSAPVEGGGRGAFRGV